MKIRDFDSIVFLDKGSIPHDMVLSWMQSPDMEALGAVWSFIIKDDKVLRRIDPPLSAEECVEFHFRYLELCLRNDPQAEYGLSRYQAAREVLSWFRFAKPEWLEDGFLQRVKEWLKDIYLTGDEDTRTAVVTGALEHILEEPRWEDFFADWRTQPELSTAYQEAMEYAEWQRLRNGETHDRPGPDV